MKTYINISNVPVEVAEEVKRIQKHFYELNVSFEEINDFKVGLHILLILSIMYLAKKTYDQISK